LVLNNRVGDKQKMAVVIKKSKTFDHLKAYSKEDGDFILSREIILAFPNVKKEIWTDLFAGVLEKNDLNINNKNLVLRTKSYQVYVITSSFILFLKDNLHILSEGTPEQICEYLSNKSKVKENIRLAKHRIEVKALDRKPKVIKNKIIPKNDLSVIDKSLFSVWK
jgi:hypothetical protein